MEYKPFMIWSDGLNLGAFYSTFAFHTLSNYNFLNALGGFISKLPFHEIPFISDALLPPAYT